MGKSRRTKRSNRRLPNFSTLTPTQHSLPGWYVAIRRRAGLYDEVIRPLRKRETFKPKATNTTSPSIGPFGPKNKKNRGFAPVTSTAPLAPVINKICVDRSTRKEIIHATGNAGKRGQKSPIWKKSSKVRC